MMNILFVDDEPNILSGLQRMLRPLRNEWNMSFASGGTDALAKLESGPMEVIVSDMKMPGMDGSELLRQVAEKYPQVIRIILSGYSEKEMIIKSIGTAHQYLSKPCDSETLKATVDRVLGLKLLLTNEKLRRLVSRLPNVPSRPTLYTELMDELAKPEPSTRVVGEIVKKDLGMTAKLLQIVNSAFFGLRRRVSDSREAVEFLGLDTISSLTLAIGVIAQMETNPVLEKIWSHSTGVGKMAQILAAMENRDVSGDSFTAGLLHDLGKVVLAANLPQEFAAAEELIKNDGMSSSDAETKVFGANHSEVGAYLLGLWGLPSQVVKAVAHHHDPSTPDPEGFTALTAVHAANEIYAHLAVESEPGAGPGFDMQYLASLGLEARAPVWLEKCSSVIQAEAA